MRLVILIILASLYAHAQVPQTDGRPQAGSNLASGEVLADSHMLPSACTKEVTPGTGVPYMFPAHGAIQFGLSSRPSIFGDDIPLAIWASNATDEKVWVLSCSDLAGFFTRGLDVLDQSGNRILSKEEVREGQAGESEGLRLTRGLMKCTKEHFDTSSGA